MAAWPRVPGTAGWVAGLLGCAMAAAAADPVVRSADHAGYGRLVFAFDDQTDFTLTRDGDHVEVDFARPETLPEATPPRNVVAYHGSAGRADLQLVPGARVESMRLGNRVVIDIRDPAVAVRPVADVPSGRPPARPPKMAATGNRTDAASAPRSAPPPSAEPVLQIPSPRRSNVDAVAQAVEQALAAPVAPIRQQDLPPPSAAPATAPLPAATPAPPPRPADDGASPPLAASAAAMRPTVSAAPLPVPPEPTLALAARRLPPDAAGGDAVLLPFGRDTGAAALRRGDDLLLVFDERRPIDLSALQPDPTSAGPSVQLLPDATLLTMPLPPDRTARLDKRADGWVARLLPSANLPSDAAGAVVPAAADGEIRLVVPNPGRVVVVPDRMTGGNLLIGTQRDGGAAARGLSVARQSPGFVLLATMQGVAVEPLSDRISLRAAPDGFRLAESGAELLPAGAPPDLTALTVGAALTRRFDFPDRATPELVRRMDALVADAAAAAPRARLAPRLAAAQAMIALGLGPEAQALLAVAVIDDPRAVETPDLAALSAIGGLLVGREDTAHALDDPRLDGSDELSFWRGVAASQRSDGQAAAAPLFAATLPLLLSYPTALRTRLLPMVAETLVEGGQTKAAERLLAAAPDDQDPGLALPRALLAEAQGDVEGALSLYNTLAVSRDRRVSARAADQAIALRLRTGRLDAAQGADALERGLFDWREPDRELARRRKIAELRAQAHAWRPALAMLRETAQLFPEAADSLHAELHDMFAAMLQDQPAVGALDLVMIADENADLMQQGDAGAKAAMLLADRLTTLDLPDRAIPLFDRLMRGAADPTVRAELGMRLAAMRLGQSDANGALASLDASDALDLPDAVREPRQLLAARALAAKGDLALATTQLTALGTSEADHLRADLLSDAKDWPGAEAALESLAARLPAGDTPLPADQQDILLRLAGAAAQAGDEPELNRLQPQASRLDGHRADLFHMLTAAPVAEVTDLPRAAQEAASARDIPSEVQTLAASTR